jgi:hypothetical protein
MRTHHLSSIVTLAVTLTSTLHNWELLNPIHSTLHPASPHSYPAGNFQKKSATWPIAAGPEIAMACRRVPDRIVKEVKR